MTVISSAARNLYLRKLSSLMVAEIPRRSFDFAAKRCRFAQDASRNDRSVKFSDCFTLLSHLAIMSSDTFSIGNKGAEFSIIDQETIFRRRERSCRDFLHVLFDRLDDRRSNLGVAFVVLGREAIEVAEQIVKDEYLSVAANARTDADCWNR